jgi:sulfofructose kinase
VTVSLDAGGTYPGIERLLPLVNILIPSEEFALKLTGCADAEAAAMALQSRYNPQVLIITQGSRGGFIAAPGGPVRYPAFPVEVVDTNGAGDTFHGAFLTARLRGMDVPEAAAFASAASALKCTKFGAQEGIPGYNEVVRFMNRKREV